ncbi:MAG: serine/threonine protein kinase [Planctomycetes bacterium]|nr:serine/threonine protein kinase [Planctomycetota bacterium]
MGSDADGPGRGSILGETMPSEAFSPAGVLAQSRPSTVSSDPLPGLPPELPGEALRHRLVRFGFPGIGPEGRRFAVEHLLGAGATGRVYAVLDRNLDRSIAAKMLNAQPRNADAESISHFIDEARITASLQHPNVLPVYELDVDERGSVFFTTRRIEGRSLGEELNLSTPANRSARIATFNDIVSLFIAVGHALAYAHHRGIIHQDIKPDNIMLGEFGEVLLVDWGSAARLDGSPVRLYGTPLYMRVHESRTGPARIRRSPERHLWPRSDAPSRAHPARADLGRRRRPLLDEEARGIGGSHHAG